MANSVTKAVQLIYGMDHNELNQVIEAIKLRRQYITKQAIRSVVVGDTVSFKGSKSGLVVGTVQKVGRKYLTVHQQDNGSIFGTSWRVPASMVEKV